MEVSGTETGFPLKESTSASGAGRPATLTFDMEPGIAVALAPYLRIMGAAPVDFGGVSIVEQVSR
jgi:hypothetical protein